MEDGLKKNSFNNRISDTLLSSTPIRYFISPALVITLTMGLFLGSVSALYAQEMIDPRSGSLQLASTDLSVKAGPINLEIHRIFKAFKELPGFMGSQWASNWESRLSRTKSEVLILGAPGSMIFIPGERKGEFKAPSGEWLIMQGDGQTIYYRSDSTKVIYDEQGRLSGFDYRNGNRVQLKYLPDGKLSRIDGPGGAFLKFTMNDQGLVTLAEASTGVKVRYTYIKDYLIEVEVDGGLPLKYGYDARGNLSRIDRPATGTVQLTYDEKSRVTARRWADGGEEYYQYDDARQTSRHTNTTGGITTIQGSSDGRREEVVDPLGHKTIIAYDESGRPSKSTGPTGMISQTQYDSLGRMISREKYGGEVTRYEYLEGTSLIRSIIYPDGHREDYEYDGNLNLTAIKEGSELIVSYTYSKEGLLTSIQGRGIPLKKFSYYPSGLLKTETDALGQATTYEYDRRGNRIRVVDATGGVTAWQYDESGRMVNITDPGGARTNYEYDAAGHCIKATDPNGAVIRYGYDNRNRLVAMTDSMGRTTRYQHDTEGNLTSKIDPAGNTYRYQYDAAGNLVKEINPIGGVFSYTYDPLGNVLSETDPTGRSWQYKYSDAGLLIHRVDPMGGITELRYDAKGLLVAESDPAGRTTHYTWDGNGRVTKVLFPDGAINTYEYGKAGYLVRESDNRGVDTTYEHDAQGRIIRKTLGKGFVSFYRYDALGRPLEWRDSMGDGRNYSYNPQGLPSSTSNVTGASIRYTYDPYSRLLEVTNPLGDSRVMTYNAAGDLTLIQSPSKDLKAYEYYPTGALKQVRHPGGGISQFAYDAMGNVIESINPLGAKTRTVFDEAGRVISTINAKGQATTYSYDLAGRVSEKRLADGKIVKHMYNPAGDLTEMDDGSFPVRYTYNLRGLLTQVEYPAIQKRLTYEYDEAGLLSKFVDSEGNDIKYEYDSARLLSRMQLPGGGVFAFGYDAKGRLTTMTYPNGVRGSWEYDVLNRPIRISYTGDHGQFLSERRYAYNAADYLTRVVDEQGKVTEYKYDSEERLIQETLSNGKAHYGYLPGGNRGKLENADRRVNYVYNKADQLLQAGEEKFTYDANGNLVRREGHQGITRYEYDSENRLVRIVKPDKTEITFGYAPTGERIWRRDSTGLTWFVTDGTNLLAELDENLKPKAIYLQGPGIDRPLAMQRDGQNYFYHADSLGSILALTDSGGKVSASYQTDAFGNIVVRRGDVRNPFVFTGRELETESGLYYYRARYYEPTLGRFLSEDPEWHPTKLNPYVYALNAPTHYRDPLGLTEESTEELMRRVIRAQARKLRVQGEPYNTPEDYDKMANAMVRNRMELVRPPSMPLEQGLKMEKEYLTERLKHLKNSIPAHERAILFKRQEFARTLRPVGPPPEAAPSPQPAPSPPGGVENISSQPGQPPPGETMRSPGYAGRGPRDTQLSPARGPGGTLIAQRPGVERSSIGASVRKGLTSLGEGAKRFIYGPTGKVMSIVEQHGGTITLTITAAQLASCKAQGMSTEDCVKEAAISAGIGQAVATVVKLLSPTGATIVIAAGAIYGGYKIYELTGEIKGAVGGELERSRIIAERAKQIQDMIRDGRLDGIIGKMENQIIGELGKLSNDFKMACEQAKKHVESAEEVVEAARNKKEELSSVVSKINQTSGSQINIYQEALAKRDEITTIQSQAADYQNRVIKGIEYANKLAVNCATNEDAETIGVLYESCSGLARGMRQKRDQAAGLNKELTDLKNEACLVNHAVGLAGQIKKGIDDIAASLINIREKAGPDFQKADELRDTLTQKCDSMLARVDNFVENFTVRDIVQDLSPDILKSIRVEIPEHKVNSLRAQVKTFRNPECDPPVIGDIDGCATRVKLMSEDAAGLLQNLNVDMDICKDMPTADSLITEIELSAALASEWVAMSQDLPSKAADCLKEPEKKVVTSFEEEEQARLKAEEEEARKKAEEEEQARLKAEEEERAKREANIKAQWDKADKLAKELGDLSKGQPAGDSVKPLSQTTSGKNIADRFERKEMDRSRYRQGREFADASRPLTPQQPEVGVQSLSGLSSTSTSPAMGGTLPLTGVTGAITSTPPSTSGKQPSVSGSKTAPATISPSPTTPTTTTRDPKGTTKASFQGKINGQYSLKCTLPPELQKPKGSVGVDPQGLLPKGGEYTISIDSNGRVSGQFQDDEVGMYYNISGSVDESGKLAATAQCYPGALHGGVGWCIQEISTCRMGATVTLSPLRLQGSGSMSCGTICSGSWK